MLRKVLPILLVLLSSCYHGLKVTGCIVDTLDSGFQCFKPGSKDGYYLSFEAGAALTCSSPADTEAFLKSCNKLPLYVPTLCSFDPHSNGFLCTSRNGVVTLIALDKASNFYCLSVQDRGRLIDRCQP
jgi:hypothetical protein